MLRLSVLSLLLRLGGGSRITGSLAGSYLAGSDYSACAVPQSLGAVSHLQIAGPASPASANATAAWLEEMRTWRKACLDALQLTGAVYEVKELQWTQTAYFQPLMMPFDRYFYNESLPGGGKGVPSTIFPIIMQWFLIKIA